MNTIDRVPHRVREWLNRRGISNNIIERYQIGWDGHRIVIPVFDQDHSILFRKYRRDPDSSNGPKYSYDPGSSAALFGIESIKKSNEIVICEGELDCLLLLSKGIAAVSSTGGSGTFDDSWTGHFTNKNVCIVFDNDDPGIKGALKVQAKIPHATVSWLPPEVGEGGDITNYFQLNGDKTPAFFLQFIKSGKSYRVPKPLYRDPETKKEMDRIIQLNSQYATSLLEEKRNLTMMNMPARHIEILLDHVSSVIEADKRRRRYMGVKAKPNADWAEKIRVAKQVPIDQYIQFTPARMAKCIWHDEKTPSMHYYKNQNRVKCFGCSQMGDTIDVIMQLYDTDMKGALKIILNE